MDPYEHDRAMADSYADQYVRARAHLIPEAMHYIVSRAVSAGYMQACAEKKADTTRNDTVVVQGQTVRTADLEKAIGRQRGIADQVKRGDTTDEDKS